MKKHTQGNRELLKALTRVVEEFKGQHIKDFANSKQFESLVLAEQAIKKATA